MDGVSVRKAAAISYCVAIPSPRLPLLSVRSPDSNKGDCGRVLVIAGSFGMAGAASLVAEGAFRSGAGYVEIACPAILMPALTQSIPSAILQPLGESDCIRLGPGFLPQLLQSAKRCDAVVIGPGIGKPLPKYPWISNLLIALQEVDPDLPIVLDADGLNHLAASSEGIEICGPSVLLTPHPGEAARLLGSPNAEAIQVDRRAALNQLIARCTAMMLLKGANTLIGGQQQETVINSSGNVGMATAGSGDVLSGHLGALLASGLSVYDAARLGAYLHGRAGDLFAAEWGQDGLTASDLALWLSKAMTEFRLNPC